MRQDFRQPKYSNESGSTQGKYFINRVDYFEFHQYPSFKKHKILSVICFFLSIHLLSYANTFSSLFWLIYVFGCLYISYISMTSFILLQRQICRYRGYLLYPKSWFKFFLSVQKEVNINDFDSLATLEKK